MADRADLGLMQEAQRAADRRFVLVTGPPGSGKTTLAGPLAIALGLTLIAKDPIKEALMEALGTPGEVARAVGLVQQPCRRCWLSRRPVAARCWRARSIPRPLTRSVPFPAASSRFGARVRGTLLSIVIAAEPQRATSATSTHFAPMTSCGRPAPARPARSRAGHHRRHDCSGQRGGGCRRGDAPLRGVELGV